MHLKIQTNSTHMFTYKFRMNFEDQEGFSRDIELRTDQTFLDFHTVISENLALDPATECAFFLCDHRYRKKKQIHQHKPENPPRKEEDEDNPVPARLYMEDCVLSDYIDDPHQKFLYVYDLRREWTFFIELARISRAAAGTDYPRIAGSVGGIPIEISRRPIPIPGELDDDDDEHADDEENETMLGSDTEGSSVFGEEDMDDMDDSGFYDDSIEISDDLDEGKP